MKPLNGYVHTLTFHHNRSAQPLYYFAGKAEIYCRSWSSRVVLSPLVPLARPPCPSPPPPPPPPVTAFATPHPPTPRPPHHPISRPHRTGFHSAQQENNNQSKTIGHKAQRRRRRRRNNYKPKQNLETPSEAVGAWSVFQAQPPPESELYVS